MRVRTSNGIELRITEWCVIRCAFEDRTMKHRLATPYVLLSVSLLSTLAGCHVLVDEMIANNTMSVLLDKNASNGNGSPNNSRKSNKRGVKSYDRIPRGEFRTSIRFPTAAVVEVLRLTPLRYHHPLPLYRHQTLPLRGPVASRLRPFTLRVPPTPRTPSCTKMESTTKR